MIQSLSCRHHTFCNVFLVFLEMESLGQRAQAFFEGCPGPICLLTHPNSLQVDVGTSLSTSPVLNFLASWCPPPSILLNFPLSQMYTLGYRMVKIFTYLVLASEFLFTKILPSLLPKNQIFIILYGPLQFPSHTINTLVWSNEQFISL